MKNRSSQLAVGLALLSSGLALSEESWVVDSQKEWEAAVDEKTHLTIEGGMASPTAGVATFRSQMVPVKTKRKAKSLLVEQSPVWLNWEPIANIGPPNLRDAPVLLTTGPDDYWIFGRYGQLEKKGKKGSSPKSRFVPQEATLEGFDVKLLTTPDPKQFNAPGGLKVSKGGYHAWQSRDMVNWVHHGPITESFSKWMTTAEYVDGKAYFYYDYPNDQDPHLYIDADLTDGEPGKNEGLAFDDPSHGSDCAVIRSMDGKFHIIAEDWSPIHAQSRSWDSPLATRGVSDDGKAPFKIMDPPVDKRTKATGKTGTYNHPHWAKEMPEKFKTGRAEYEIHEPEQEAFGDWAAIAIGGQYYLFGDYDPAGGHKMSVGWFTADSINGPFEWCGKIGNGHPDPDVMFGEGRFYLATQQGTDYVSDGPWVESVEVRVGVDVDQDGKVDRWSEWEKVKEGYELEPGFSKQVRKTPAAVDLTGLPAGFGFQVEVKLTDATENESKPILDKLTLSFGE